MSITPNTQEYYCIGTGVHDYTSRFLGLAMYNRSHITTVATASWSSRDGTLQLIQQGYNAVAAEYPQCTFTGTPPCSSHRVTALYETYEAGQRNLDV